MLKSICVDLAGGSSRRDWHVIIVQQFPHGLHACGQWYSHGNFNYGFSYILRAFSELFPERLPIVIATVELVRSILPLPEQK